MKMNALMHYELLIRSQAIECRQKRRAVSVRAILIHQTLSPLIEMQSLTFVGLLSMIEFALIGR